MRPIRQTVSAAGASAPAPMDIYIAPFQVSIAVVLSAGAVLTYKVQHTFDDVWAKGFDPSTATWFDSTDLTGETASAFAVHEFPVTALRLNVTAYTSGTATINLIQSGLTGV